MRTTITKIMRFDAAHSLPNHEGKCREIHGHGYSVEVTIEGRLHTSGPATAMVMDFADLSDTIARLVVDPLDHHYLNDILDFVPTAEAMAGYMFTTLTAAGLPVVRVRLWETPSSYAEVTA